MRYRWLAAGVGLLGGAALLAPRAARALADRLADRFIVRLLHEPYGENLWAVAAGLRHSPLFVTMENALRAQGGHPPSRPVGPARRFLGFEGLVFRPAQLARRPLQPRDPVETTVVIGPRARRPLRLDVPVLIGGMAYGTGLSREFALALAHGASRAGTAYNAGNAPLLPEVRRAARRLIVQYTGSAFTASPGALSQGDAIEIRIGRGAWAGMGKALGPGSVPGEALRRAGMAAGAGFTAGSAVMGSGASAGPGAAGSPLTIPSGPLGREDAASELCRLVAELRQLGGGVPVGVKLAAGHDLEADLDVALQAGVDFVSVDGAEGGTHGGPPILQDDFGIPTVMAVCRARQHLDRRGAGRGVTLLVGGGLLTPGDCLKCLALGADAVYLGTAVLFAAAHAQAVHALPWEPVVQLAWARGSLRRKFDWKEGARSVTRFIRAVAEEMAVGARALGKSALRDVGREDLVALDPQAAAATGLPLAFGEGGPTRG